MKIKKKHQSSHNNIDVGVLIIMANDDAILIIMANDDAIYLMMMCVIIVIINVVVIRVDETNDRGSSNYYASVATCNL